METLIKLQPNPEKLKIAKECYNNATDEDEKRMYGYDILYYSGLLYKVVMIPKGGILSRNSFISIYKKTGMITIYRTDGYLIKVCDFFYNGRINKIYDNSVPEENIENAVNFLRKKVFR